MEHFRNAHQGKPNFHCEACIEAKLRVKPFPKQTNRVINRVGQELHHDYVELQSRDPWGNTGVQVYSIREPGFIFIDFITTKAHIGRSVVFVKRSVETHCNKSIEILQGDSSRENGQKLIVEECKRTGTHTQFSQPGDSNKAQNGYIESLIGELKRSKRAVMWDAGMSDHFKAAESLAYRFCALARNLRQVKTSNGMVTSRAEIYQRRPLSDIRKLVFTFGSLAQCLHNYDGRSKKKDRTFFGVYLGVHPNIKAAIVLNVETGKFTTSRTFKINETI